MDRTALGRDGRGRHARRPAQRPRRRRNPRAGTQRGAVHVGSAQLIVHGEAIAVALPTDPRSAEEVPQADDLSVVAATGFKVRRIGVQETDAPI